MEIMLNWEKRLSSNELDANREYLSKNGGIYIWIFKGKPERITYIGEADSFWVRFYDHYGNILAGKWTTYAMGAKDDFVDYLFQYYVGKSEDDIRKEKRIYMPVMVRKNNFSFKETFFNEIFGPVHLRYLKSLDFAFATGIELHDKKIRREVESVLIKGVRRAYSIHKSDSTVTGLVKFPIGRINRHPSQSYLIRHNGALSDKIPNDLKRFCDYDLSGDENRVS